MDYFVIEKGIDDRIKIARGRGLSVTIDSGIATIEGGTYQEDEKKTFTEILTDSMKIGRFNKDIKGEIEFISKTRISTKNMKVTSRRGFGQINSPTENTLIAFDDEPILQTSQFARLGTNDVEVNGKNIETYIDRSYQNGALDGTNLKFHLGDVTQIEVNDKGDTLIDPIKIKDAPYFIKNFN